MKKLLYIAKIIPSSIKKPSKAIHLLLIVLFASYCNTNYSQTTDNTPGTRIFTVPANVTSVTASVWGGGGGGGGSNINGSGGNGGGGGGAISQVFSVVATNTFTYTVGTGGLAGNSSGGTGGNGSNSSATFNPTATTITATAGTGGRGNALPLNNPANSGGGTPSGINGALGGALGGNGGSSGTVVGIFGVGGAGRIDNTGLPGIVPGGGGGGGERTGSGSAGGVGANGQVFFNYISVSGVSPNPVCFGNTITITGTNFSATSTTITVGGVACTSVNRVSATSITAVIGAGTPGGSQNVVITNTNGTNNAQNITVIIPSVAPTSISGTTTICNGGSTTLTAVGGTLGTGANYQWGTGSVVGTSPISGETASTLTVSPSSSTTYWVRIESTTSPCTANTSGISQLVTVNTSSVAPTSISGTTTICNGGSTTLTAVGGTLGSGANYQWGTGSVVGTSPISGQTASTLTISPSSSTTYWVRIENTATPCTEYTSGISQLVTVIIPSVAPTSISGTTAICEVGSTTLTAVGGTLGTGANYQWGMGSVVGTSPISGETASTLTVSPSSSTTYWVRIESTTSPCTANTSGISQLITVNSLPSVGAVSANQTICSGNLLSSNITITSATGTIQWQRADNAGFTSNVINIGTNSTTLTSVEIGTLTATKYFRAVVTSGVCPFVTSGTVTITVDSNPNVGAVSANQTICTGSNPSSNITLSSATGTIQWQSADDAGFTSGLTNIGTNSTTLTTTEIGTLTATKYFRAIVTNGVCLAVTSGTVSVTVNSLPVGPVIAKSPNDIEVCAGTTLTISVTTAGTGGAVSSQDEYRYDTGSGFTAWSTAIPNFTAVTGTNIVESRRTSTGAGCTTAAGNTVSWTVNPIPVAPIIVKNPNDLAVCSGATLTITVNTAGTGGAISSQDEYRFSTDNGTNWSAWSISIPNFTAVAGTNIEESRRTSIGAGCTTAAGNTVSWTVNAIPVGPIIAKNPNATEVCSGTILTITSTAGTGGAISSQDEYRFSTDNGANWSAWGTSLPSFAAVTGTNIIESRRTSTGSGCTTAGGNTVSWTVNALPIAPVIVKNPNVASVCIGATLSISVTTAGTGGAISSQDEYRFSTNNGSNWSSWSTTIPNFAAVIGTNIIESRRTSTGLGCTTAAGNTVSWTVNPLPIAPVIAKNPNVASVCVGATLTISVTTAGTGGAISSQDEYRYNAGSGYTAWSTTVPNFSAGIGTNIIESRRTSTGSGCTTSSINTVSWTVNPDPVSGTLTKTPNTLEVCDGTTVSANATAGSGGSDTIVDELEVSLSGGAYSTYISGSSINTTGQTSVSIRTRRTATGSGCATSSYNVVTWIVNPLPIADAGFDSTIFRGDATTTPLGAVAVGSNTYSWVSNPIGFTSFISNPTVNPLVNTTYTLTETTPKGCQKTNSVIVTVKDNLVITKSLISSAPTKPGDIITYQISYENKNNGGIAAENVTITDILPSTAFFTYTSSSPAGTYIAGSNTLTYTIPSLVAGAPGLITVSGRVGVLGGYGYDTASYYISSGSSSQTLTNSASIVNPVTPAIVSNVSNIVTQNCGVSMPATLSGQVHTSTGSNVYYFIEVENTGNSTDRFSLSNTIPAQTGDVPLTSLITNMAGDAISLTPWLAPGQKYGFLVQFTTPIGTPPNKWNYTSIRATSTVCTTFASTYIDTYVYQGPQPSGCDLLISKTASASSIVAGANITYTIVVRNLRSNKARDLVIDDILPANLNYISATQTGADNINYNSSTRLIRVTRAGNYDNGNADIVITITAQTTCASVPSVLNSATVDNKNADDNVLNNESNVTVTVLPNVSDPAPTSAIICSGNSTTITLPSPGANRDYKWYSAATGGTLIQPNGNSYLTPTLTSTTTYYVSQYNTLDSTCESNRTPITITVVSPPVVIGQPTDITICGTTASFTYNVSGTFLSQQWQVSTDGGINWNNLSNSGVYSGVTTQTLNISNMLGLYGYKYRCNLTSHSCYTSTSTVASIVSLPTISGTLSVCSGSTTTLTGSGTPDASTPWTSSNLAVATVNNLGVVTGVTAGTSVITYKSSNNCTITAIITVNGLPTISGSLSICNGSSSNLTGSATANTTTPWTSASPSIVSINSSGLITALTTGTSVITYQNNNGCTTTATVTVNPVPIITIQPVNQLDCEGATVNFEVTATGSGLNYTWQRKLPTDVSFSTVSAGGNIAFPNPNEIRIQNVGSSQSIDGTQYQVIVSNGFCSVTSSIAILSVNTITGLSPISTNVTQCYGTNYSYTVSTSYPTNVVSYQWKSSVTSGIWNDVVDGVHFSGTNTATLNIINGTPAESAEYRVYITFTSSGANCNVSSTSRNRRITFLPLLTTPVTSVTQPTCSTSTGTITVTVQSASDTYSFDNGITYQASNVKSGLATGNYNIIIKNTQNCVSPTTIATIDPQPVTPIQPTLSLAALPTCNTLGSFTITNHNASYTYTVSPNIGVSLSGNTVTAPAGNYSVIATLGSCSSISSASINVPSLVTNTWTTSGWSTGFAPTINSLVIIDSNYNTSTNGDLNACSVTVNVGKTLTITANDYAIIQNDLTVNGIVDVLDKGSLIMVNDSGIVTNNGTTTVRRFTSPFEKFDYVYWSTPVESTFIPSTFLNWRTNYAFEFLPANFVDTNNDSFDDDSNDWSYASTMSLGKGYIVMTPTNKAMYPSVEEIVFSGKVNNGVITTPIALTPSSVDPGDDFNLVGNPYPSAISADAFINANINAITNTSSYKTIGGTLYFWTHIGDISNTNGGPDGLNFSTNDYAVYTLAGGVQAGFGGTIPSGFIASGQGFFVEADNAGSLLFNNAMRLNTETKNNQFYKLQSNNKKSTNISKDRLWLNLQNTSNLFSQQLIGYFDNATLGYDKGYDGLFSDAGNYINFYSFIDNETYKIQGRSSFYENDQVRLGYSSKIAGTFTIAIDTKEGVFTNPNQAVYIEDKMNNTIFDLKIGPYSFTTEKGTFNDRFILRYTDTKSLSIDEINLNEGLLVFYSKNYNTLIINNDSKNTTVNSVSLYNINGQKISNWEIENQDQKIIQIPVKKNSTGIYIVKVKTSEGEISKKISID